MFFYNWGDINFDSWGKLLTFDREVYLSCGVCLQKYLKKVVDSFDQLSGLLDNDTKNRELNVGGEPHLDSGNI